MFHFSSDRIHPGRGSAQHCVRRRQLSVPLLIASVGLAGVTLALPMRVAVAGAEVQLVPVPPGRALTIPPNAVIMNGAVYMPMEGQPGQLVPVQPMVSAPGGAIVWVPASQGVVPPGGLPSAPPAPPAAPPAPVGESPALRDAKYRLRSVESEIRDVESRIRFLSPPIRTTDGKGNTTYDVSKQRQYEQDKARYEKRLRDLRADKAMWEMRINTLMTN